MSVVLAHPHEQVRTRIKHALEHRGMTVLGEAKDAAQATWLAVKRRPKVFLIDDDISLPDAALAEIRHAVPSMHIAILGSSDSESRIMAALLAGADGYLLKSIAPDRLSLALAALARGEATFPRSFTTRLVAEIRTPPRPSFSDRVRRRLLYPARFVKHLRHRRRNNLSLGEAVAATRQRMREYA